MCDGVLISEWQIGSVSTLCGVSLKVTRLEQLSVRSCCKSCTLLLLSESITESGIDQHRLIVKSPVTKESKTMKIGMSGGGGECLGVSVMAMDTENSIFIGYGFQRGDQDRG